jgi:hypothetical protein
MSNATTPSLSSRFSPRAAFVGLGLRLQQLQVFGPIREQVHMAQKTVKYTPIQKVSDAFIALLAGAHGLGEINKRLRADPSLPAAFGRKACAEQSVVLAPREARNLGSRRNPMKLVAVAQ